MRPTTVKLPDRVEAVLRHEAHRRGITISELTRDAIETHLGLRDRRLGAAGAGRGGRSDISMQKQRSDSSEIWRRANSQSNPSERVTGSALPNSCTGTGTCRSEQWMRPSLRPPSVWV